MAAFIPDLCYPIDSGSSRQIRTIRSPIFLESLRSLFKCFLNEVCHSLLAIFSCLVGEIEHLVLLRIRYKKSVTMNTRVMEGEAFFLTIVPWQILVLKLGEKLNIGFNMVSCI